MTTADLDAVRRVEVIAAERFRSVSDPRIARCADDEPFTIEELLPFVEGHRAWVAVEGGQVAGFAIAERLDGNAHLAEIAVAPDYERRGHGAALVAEVVRWASSNGLIALTLTTFRDVPWNRPWYERLGFRTLTEPELTPALRRLRDAEDARGLSAELRVVMRLVS